MNIWFVLVLGAAIGLLALLWHWAKQPRKYKGLQVGDLRRLLTTLLHRGYDGGFLMINVQGPSRDPRFIQFSKYVGNKKVGLQFDFPLAMWSQPSHERLKQNLSQKGVDFRLEKTFRHDTKEFLTIDLAQDLDMAEKVAEVALFDAFGLDKRALLEAFFVNVSPKDERSASSR